jgi:hypothetical protein
MLKISYGEECLCTRSEFEWHKRRAQKSENEKTLAKTMLTVFIDAKSIIRREFLPEENRL